MRRTVFALILLLLFFLVDFYVFQAVRTVTQNLQPNTRKLIHFGYWGITVLSVLMLVYVYAVPNNLPWPVRTYVNAFLFVVFVSKLFVSLLLAMEDITRLVRWVIDYFTVSKTAGTTGTPISRNQFFNMLALILGALPFSAFLYGIVVGAYDYKVRKVKLKFANLPDAFNGYRFVQISDMHTGSFRNTKPLEKAVALINRQKADLVVFTGDLVNNIADELEPHLDTLSRISAPDGVLSILGNHDYGDYVGWDNDDMKGRNLTRLKNMQTQTMGWKLLLNTHHPISRGGEQIAFVGVENWSAKGNFPKYGRLADAMHHTQHFPFKVLLSHDPSHWLAQVVKHYPDIDLTLSGHTHGMQFGVRIPGFKWSPVQYVYDQWAGIYQAGKQYLYVNTGLGFLGYPGRIGIRPEITVFELVKA